MLDNGEYSPPPMVAAESFTCMTKKNNKNKRRFSDEQIKSLETMFELESRLEPHKKQKLAGELGLQPRQVAIWFQNKRARWKSTQLERNYNILRANYNSLASMFEAVKKEKQALVAQLHKLNDLMLTPEERHCCRPDQAANSTHSESGNGDTTKCESDPKPTLSTYKSEEQGRGVLSDEDIRIKEEYSGLGNEPNLLKMVEVDSSIRSPEDWGSWNSDGLFNLSTSDPQWLDFWS